MTLSDQQKMKFDRRLENRRSWLEPGELEAELAALPDAAGKIMEEVAEESAEASEETAAVQFSSAASEPSPDPFGSSS